MRQFLFLAASLFLSATSALADTVTGAIIAYDRLANVIVLEDKTVWEIVPPSLALPADLKAGDVVTIDFVSAGEDGVEKINSVTRQ